MTKGKKRQRSAYDTAVHVLSLRDHGTEELRRKLAGKGYDYDEIDEVIVRLSELNYLNDNRVARQLVHSMFRRRKGLEAVRRWLYSHGFARELIEEISHDEEYAEQELSVCQEAKERLTGTREKLWIRLKRRGFRQQTIAKVLIVDGD